MSAQVTIEGLDRVDVLLARLQRAVEDPREALDGFADEFASNNRAAFSGGRLVDTGALRASLTSRPLGVERVSRDGVEVGTDVRYARFHARKLGIDARTHAQAWRDRLARHLGEATR